MKDIIDENTLSEDELALASGGRLFSKIPPNQNAILCDKCGMPISGAPQLTECTNPSCPSAALFRKQR